MRYIQIRKKNLEIFEKKISKKKIVEIFYNFENLRFSNFNFLSNIFKFFFLNIVYFILYKKTFIIKKYFNQKVF